MAPYDSDDLTDVIELSDEMFVVLRSPNTAEHDPAYTEVARFETAEAAKAFIAEGSPTA